MRLIRKRVVVHKTSHVSTKPVWRHTLLPVNVPVAIDPIVWFILTARERAQDWRNKQQRVLVPVYDQFEHFLVLYFPYGPYSVHVQCE